MRIAAAAAVTLFATVTTAHANAFDHVVGTVDGTAVWQSELDDARALDPASSRDAVADTILVRHAAHRYYYEATDAEIDEALVEIGKQNNLSLDELKKVVADRGATWDGYRENLRDQILAARVERLYPRAELLATGHANAAITWRPDVAHDASGDPKGTVKEIVVTGKDVPPELRDRVRSALAVLAGAPLDHGSRVAARRALAKIFDEQAIAAAEITAQATSRGVRVSVALEAQPVIAEVAPASTELTAMVGHRLDPVALGELRERLVNDALDGGHPRATGRWSLEPRSDGTVSLHLDIEKGPGIVVSSVDFDGNRSVTTAELRVAVAKYLSANDDWVQERVEAATLMLSAAYWDHGFAQVKVTPPETPTAGGSVSARFTIVEGKQYRFGRIRTSGMSEELGKKDLARTPLHAGDLFSRTALADARAVMEPLVADQAGAGANLVITTHIDEDTRTVDVTFEVTR